MAMSPVLLRPRRKQAVAPSGPASPTEPIGVNLTTAPLAPTSVGLTSQPSNLVVQEVFAPDAPTGVTASPVANAPSAPTNVSLATVPSAPTSIGLTGQPGSVVVQEVFAPDAPTGVTLTPQSTDPYFSNVVLLLQDSLADQSLQGQTVVARGNAAASTAQVKYGTHSIYFDGNGDYLTTSALPLGTADYTLESWFYIDTLTNQPFAFTGIPHNQSGSHLWVCLILGGGYGITVGYTGGGSAGQIKSTTVPAAGQWYHLAVVRNGGVTTIYLDGSSIASGNQHNGINFANSQPEIGTESNSNRALNGFLDSIRLTAGVARYTANFTPPAQAFPN